MLTFEIDKKGVPLFFQIFYLLVYKNWDFSEVLFRQKFPKAAIALWRVSDVLSILTQNDDADFILLISIWLNLEWAIKIKACF